uniref:Gamma-tubulin complex component n=1 Tax=Syphacia muris TaxID=451379 RepID=A0A0N5ALL7_9BILA
MATFQNTTAKWRTCRQEIVTKIVPFSSVDDAFWYLSERPESFFTPMKEIDLSRHSVSTQEQLFVRDLLVVYTGCQGENIRYVLSNDNLEWTVNPSADECLRARLYTEGGLQLAGLLILLQYYVKVISNDFSRGRVALSITALAKEFLRKEVLSSVRNLEVEMRNSVQMLNIFTVTTRMRPFLQTVKELMTVFSNIYKRELIGGEILSYIGNQARFCVLPNTTDLLLKLEYCGLKQYLTILFSWICYGSLLEDYYHEFMIWDLSRSGIFTRRDVLGDEENKENAVYMLEDKFCVIKALCPKQLIEVFTDIINCGKYMRFMQKLDVNKSGCNEKIFDENILNSWQDKTVEDVQQEIKEIRSKASKLLIVQLRKSFKMEAFFETLHGFFFLTNSDWLGQFFDLTEDVLSHPVDCAMVKKVQVLFDESVNASCLRMLDFRDIFRVSFEKSDIFTLFYSITNSAASSVPKESGDDGIATSSSTDSLNSAILNWCKEEIRLRGGNLVNAAALTLKINLAFPLTLMFPFGMLLNYELVFRTLKLLLNDLLGEERVMLQSMLHFLNGHLSHCVVNVIPNLSRAFLTKISKSTSLEDVLDYHKNLFEQLFEKCFFSDYEFMSNLFGLVEVVIGYSTDILSFDEAFPRWKFLVEKLNAVLMRTNNAYDWLHAFFSHMLKFYGFTYTSTLIITPVSNPTDLRSQFL